VLCRTSDYGPFSAHPPLISDNLCNWKVNSGEGGYMKGYVVDIEKATKENGNFRKVLYTGQNSQLVVMSLKPGEDIGEEVHGLDQFIRIEAGEGKAILDGVEHRIEDDFAIVIPAGTKHNIVNTSSGNEMKLYSVYSPPEHRDGVLHKTKAEAMVDDEHFDGKTTEEAVFSL
jgi:mannose-6-phosphate isomerase-like protein (cupin superfamily)